MYHVGANEILIKPFQTKSSAHRIPAHNRVLERLKAAGMQVDLQIMDNEVSKAYLDNITGKCKNKYQLVPQDMHRRNAAERAIQVAKAHFITILYGVDPGFPKLRWDLLLPQTELILN